MAQILAFVVATASICGVMLALTLRTMASQRSELSIRLDNVETGLKEKIDGLRNEMHAKIQITHEKIDGLRFEMNARLEPFRGDVDRLDQDVRELKKEISNSAKPQFT